MSAARDTAQHEAAEAAKRLIQAEAELAKERLHGGGDATSSSARKSAHVRKTTLIVIWLISQYLTFVIDNTSGDNRDEDR